MLRRFVKAAGSALGLHVQDKHLVPWGMNKLADIIALSNGHLSVALDVGANIGQTVQAIKSVSPSTLVYAFEPVPSSFTKLKQNVQAFPGVQCFETAMGAAAGRANMAANDLSGTNSLLSVITNENYISIDIDTVDAFCGRNGISSVDMLKIDTEGYELEVLKGAAEMLQQNRVRFVLAECEFAHRPTEPHGDFFEIASYLRSLGYRLVSTYTEGVDGEGWKWGDALFMLPFADSRLRLSPFGQPLDNVDAA